MYCLESIIMEPQMATLGKTLIAVVMSSLSDLDEFSICQAKYIKALHKIHMTVLEQTHWQLT